MYTLSSLVPAGNKAVPTSDINSTLEQKYPKRGGVSGMVNYITKGGGAVKLEDSIAKKGVGQ